MAPKDIKSETESLALQLQELKNRKIYLSRMIKSLDEKNAAARTWIETHRKNIITAYKSLSDLVEQNDIASIHKTLSASESTAESDVLGVVLDIPDQNGRRLGAYIMEKFGDDHALEDVLSKIQLGIPQHIFHQIDEDVKKDIDSLQSEVADSQQQSKWWKRITGAEDREFKNAIREVKSELLGVEMQPAFTRAMVRSLFDWVEANTLPAEEAEASAEEIKERDVLLSQADSAEYVIRLAQHDFNETLRGFTEMIVEDSNDYLAFTKAIAALDTPENRFEFERYSRTPRFDIFSGWACEQLQKKSVTQYAHAQLGYTADFIFILDCLAKNTSSLPLNALLGEQITTAGHGRTFLAAFKDDILNRAEYQTIVPWKTLAQAFEKSGLSYAHALARSGLVSDIYKARANDATKIALLSAALNANGGTNLDDDSAFVKKAMALLADLKSTKHDLSIFDVREMDSADFQGIHAFARLLAPQADILKKYLGHPLKANSAIAFITLWEQGVTSVKQSYDADIKQVISNATQSKAWAEILPRFYQADDDTFMATVMNALFDKGDNGETAFDKIYQSGDADYINLVMSFLENPVERARFYEQAADKTDNADLKTAYLDNVKALDSPLLEYQNGYAVNISRLANAYYDGQDVRVIADGREIVLEGIKNTTHAGYIFDAMKRLGMMAAGNELINPDVLDYAEIMADGDETKLDIFSKGMATPVYLEDPSEASTILDNIAARNPELMRLNDSLVNLSTLSQVFFDDENTAYFIKGGTCLVSFTMEESERNHLISEIEKKGNYIKIGASLFNADQIDAAGYSCDSGQLLIKAGGIFYDGQRKIRYFNDAFSRFVLPEILADAAEYSVFSQKLKNRGFCSGTAFDEGLLVNPARLCAIEKIEDDDYILSFHGDKTALSLTGPHKDLRDDLVKKARLETIGDLLVNIKSIDNVYFEQPSVKKTPALAHVICGEHSFKTSIPGDTAIIFNQLKKYPELVDTGMELLQGKRINLAFILAPTSDFELDITFNGQSSCLAACSNSHPEQILQKLIAQSKKTGSGSTPMAAATRIRTPEIAAKLQEFSCPKSSRNALAQDAESMLFGPLKDRPAKASQTAKTPKSIPQQKSDSGLSKAFNKANVDSPHEGHADTRPLGAAKKGYRQ